MALEARNDEVRKLQRTLLHDGMSVKDWAIAAIQPAIDDWEAANGTSSPHESGWKEAAFFYLKQMKGHPKLVQATAIQAAGALKRLFDQVVDVHDFFDGEGMAADDVEAYTLRRWDSIKWLPGCSPLDTALKITKATAVEFSVPQAVYEAYENRRPATDADRKDTRQHPLRVPWDKLASSPTYGLYLGTVWNLHKQLSVNGEKPALILGGDSVSKLLNVTSKTAWDYRCTLEKHNLITKLPKNGRADRFHLRPDGYQNYMAWCAFDGAGLAAAMKSINLD